MTEKKRGHVKTQCNKKFSSIFKEIQNLKGQ
uniref:Uncharacterized protein n=1 Tax=Rhizophora mucronata TaxID=61149 RepID=A0A2P2QKL5_RHIMU